MNRKRRAVIPLLLIVGMAVVFSIFTLSSGSAPSYRRYISPPLTYGIRYTLLYPSDMVPRQAPHSPFRIVYKHNPLIETFQQYARRLGLRAFLPDEQIGVDAYVIEPEREIQIWDRQQVLSNRAWRQKRFWDAETRTLFTLTHSCGKSTIPLYRKTDPVIIGSFQVLQPGAEVPKE